MHRSNGWWPTPYIVCNPLYGELGDSVITIEFTFEPDSMQAFLPPQNLEHLTPPLVMGIQQGKDVEREKSGQTGDRTRVAVSGVVESRSLTVFTDPVNPFRSTTRKKISWLSNHQRLEPTGVPSPLPPSPGKHDDEGFQILRSSASCHAYLSPGESLTEIFQLVLPSG